MRSVEVYLRHTNSEVVVAFLSRAFPLQKGPPWICEVNGDACLYIDFAPYNAAEQEPEVWDDIVKNLGGEPQVVVAADVSGRHSGSDEVKHFIETMLTAFEGVAQDGYTSYCWSRDEVLNNHKVQGHCFFDYQGWYDQEKS